MSIVPFASYDEVEVSFTTVHLVVSPVRLNSNNFDCSCSSVISTPRCAANISALLAVCVGRYAVMEVITSPEAIILLMDSIAKWQLSAYVFFEGFCTSKRA